MSFKDQLKAELQQLESANSDFDNVKSPYSKLKHEVVRLSKDEPSKLVRILPPTSPDGSFAVGHREMFIDVTNAKGKQIRSGVIMPLHQDADNYLLDRKVPEWVATKTMPNTYGSKPSVRYFLNVIQLQDQGNGQYLHELDQQGNPIIRMMQLPYTAYQAVVESMVDEHTVDPEGATDGFGAISAKNAYPFSIYRKGEQTDTKYYARLYERDLGPLPEGWENFAEDLNYQATPVEDYDKEFVEYMVAVHEGQEEAFNNRRRGDSGQGQGQAQTQAQAPTQQAPAPTQGGFGNQPTPTPAPTPTQQQAQAQGGFGQPIADTGNQGFNQSSQDEQPQAQGGFGTPTPAPATPPAQETQEQQQPAQPAGDISAPDVDSLLEQVRRETGQ